MICRKKKKLRQFIAMTLKKKDFTRTLLNITFLEGFEIIDDFLKVFPIFMTSLVNSINTTIATTKSRLHSQMIKIKTI